MNSLQKLFGKDIDSLRRSLEEKAKAGADSELLNNVQLTRGRFKITEKRFVHREEGVEKERPKMRFWQWNQLELKKEKLLKEASEIEETIRKVQTGELKRRVKWSEE